MTMRKSDLFIQKDNLVQLSEKDMRQIKGGGGDPPPWKKGK